MEKYMSQNQLNRVMPIRIADAKLKIRHVFIRDYLTTCLIGIYAHEKANKQRVRINIDLAASETDHPINDKIVNVVCYEKLVNGIDEIANAIKVSPNKIAFGVVIFLSF